MASTTIDISSSEKPFPFMKLPAELRNNVYEHVILESKAYCQLNVKPTVITSGSPMASVNKEVRKEFMSLLGITPWLQIGSVHNLDFRQLIHFMTRFKLREGFKDIVNAGLVIRLQCGTPDWERQDRAPPQKHVGLEQWLRFLKHERRAGRPSSSIIYSVMESPFSDLASWGGAVHGWYRAHDNWIDHMWLTSSWITAEESKLEGQKWNDLGDMDFSFEVALLADEEFEFLG